MYGFFSSDKVLDYHKTGQRNNEIGGNLRGKYFYYVPQKAGKQ